MGNIIKNDIDVTNCPFLKKTVKKLNWGFAIEYIDFFKCKRHPFDNEYGCGAYKNCDFKKNKRLNYD